MEWKHVLVLLWLVVLQGVGLYIFTGGFFLTRYEVTNKSHCDRPPGAADELTLGELLARHQGSCWYPRRFKRAILVIVDALRYDFARYEEGTGDNSSSYFLNHLPVFHRHLRKSPSKSRLYQFEADPPTVTMQRLKGLTTGGLPTFIDFRENLASTEIEEDNILFQMGAQGRRMTFMGDDTWVALFPTIFTASFPYPSYDVKDLHTVDRGVKAHLLPAIKAGDNDLIVAHFLGVDHVGHTFGPDHPAMQDKLEEINQELEAVLQAADNDTIVLIFGDHGMTHDGNHGGATPEELGAALFLYAPGALPAGSWNLTSILSDLDPQRKDVKHRLNFETSPASPQTEPIVIPQVDIVPTLALLLGLPIPFANLGSVIPDLFFHAYNGLESTPDSSFQQEMQALNDALFVNARQVREYVLTYAKLAGLPVEELLNLEAAYEGVSEQWKKAKDSGTAGKTKLTRKLQKYLRDALAMGRQIWTQFDLNSMGMGIGTMAFSVCLLAFLLSPSKDDPSSAPCRLSFPPWEWLAIAPVAGLLTVASAFVFKLGTVKTGFLLFLYSGGIAILTFGKAAPSTLVSNVKGYQTKPKVSVVTAAGLLLLALHSYSIFSNSFVVAEHHVVAFLYVSGSIVLAWEVLCIRGCSMYGQPNVQIVTVSHLGTFLPYFFVPYAPPSLAIFIFDLTCQLCTFLPFLNLPLHLPVLKFSNIFADSCGSLRVSAFSWGSLSLVVQYILVLVYWTSMDNLPDNWRLMLPRGVYVLSLVWLAVLLFRPTIALGYTSGGLRMQEWCRKFLLAFAPSYLLVLGPTSPIIVAFLLAQLQCLMQLARAYDRLPLGLPILLGFSSSHFFFATGHHNNISFLQNAAGFVGFTTFNYYIAGTLLALNTFGSYTVSIFGAAALLPDRSKGGGEAFLTLILGLNCYFSLNTTVTMVSVSALRRHLMVWAIFAPKFIFDSVILVYANLQLLLLALAAPRMQRSVKSGKL